MIIVRRSDKENGYAALQRLRSSGVAVYLHQDGLSIKTDKTLTPASMAELSEDLKAVELMVNAHPEVDEHRELADRFGFDIRLVTTQDAENPGIVLAFVDRRKDLKAGAFTRHVTVPLDG